MNDDDAEIEQFNAPIEAYKESRREKERLAANMIYGMLSDAVGYGVVGAGKFESLVELLHVCNLQLQDGKRIVIRPSKHLMGRISKVLEMIDL
jgi:hypothetical protein